MNIIDFPYKISKPVESYDQIKTEADELKRFILNKKNFKGKMKKMYAIHHSQVSTDPYNFFVLHPKLVLGQGDQVWPSRVIINPEIIWTDPNPLAWQELLEACASFPYHSPIKARRCLNITVKYQILKPDGSLETIKEPMTNLKAEIFSHETDHGLGQTIYSFRNKSDSGIRRFER